VPRACTYSEVSEITLDSWLEQQDVSPRVSKVITLLGGACMDVASRIRTASCDSYSCFNEYGDEQIAVDLVAEQLMVDALRECEGIAAVSTPLDPLGCLDPTGCYSEDINLVEQQARQQQQRGTAVPSAVPPDLDSLSVCLDPLDGSSIIDTNFAVGSVFGVWRAPSLLNVTGRGLLAAGTCTYGPRTTLTVGLGIAEGVAEFLLVGECSPSGRWVLANTYSAIGEGRLFAPGNLRAVTEHPGYAQLIHYWQQNRYQLRYTGGMVPDVMQLIVKGKGVFCTPAPPDQPGPVRLLHEAVPLAFLIEKCGGASSDGSVSLLDIPVAGLGQRTQMAVGSAAEVERFNAMVGPQIVTVPAAAERE